MFVPMGEKVCKQLRNYCMCHCTCSKIASILCKLPAMLPDLIKIEDDNTTWLPKIFKTPRNHEKTIYRYG